MAKTVHFDFTEKHNSYWNMKPACGTDATASVNPAPVTNPCIYIIHNENTNQTYVGYADNANHRWNTRTETFHCLGIDRAYAKKVHCAYCYPREGDKAGNNLTKIGAGFLEGKQRAEHLLMRAVANGLLGVTTCTNTRDAKTLFTGPIVISKVAGVVVRLPAKFGALDKAKYVALPPAY